MVPVLYQVQQISQILLRDIAPIDLTALGQQNMQIPEAKHRRAYQVNGGPSPSDLQLRQLHHLHLLKQIDVQLQRTQAVPD